MSDVSCATVEDLVAEAAATTPRPAEIAQLDFDARQLVAQAAHRRAEVLAAAARGGFLDATVLDRACASRRWTLVGFIRHCAQVQHHVADLIAETEEHSARDWGRQGETGADTQEPAW